MLLADVDFSDSTDRLSLVANSVFQYQIKKAVHDARNPQLTVIAFKASINFTVKETSIQAIITPASINFHQERRC
jgi:hypothetical protein